MTTTTDNALERLASLEALYRDLTRLYDLQADPYEMKNLANDPAAAEVRRELESQLERLITQ